MTETLSDLERDIEESRARLDRTIDRIQDRLTPRHLVEEVIGSARQTPLNGLYDSALAAVRGNPVPVLLIAAGVGMLLNRMSTTATLVGPARREPRTDPVAGALPGDRAITPIVSDQVEPGSVLDDGSGVRRGPL